MGSIALAEDCQNVCMHEEILIFREKYVCKTLEIFVKKEAIQFKDVVEPLNWKSRS